MNSSDKNNPPLDAILRRTMRESPGDATSDCPDAGVIAAYYDRSMSSSEREHLEQHFADCARCQMNLASIARADSGIVEAAKRSPVAWLRGLRIAIPALAAAAAILIAIRFTRNTENQFERQQLVAMSKPEAAANAPVTESLASSQTAPPNEAPAAPAVGELALNEPKRAPAMEERSAPLADQAKPLAKEKSRDTFAGSARARTEAFAEKRAMRAEAAAEPETQTLAGTEAEASGEAAPSSGGALAMRTDTAAAKAPSSSPLPDNSLGVAAGSAGSASAGAASAFAERGTASSSFAYPVRPTDPGFNAVVSVEGAVWEIGPKGKIARSVTGGEYVAQNSGVSADLLAGAATSRDVCWIGGRAGTILRTTDGGANWRKIASPTSDDITQITASSADRASITTVSGKNFATADGGATWRPQ
ncbi:MAG: hypothetical protein Q7S58_11920 [Candidatus Binatus sp.]|uniref:hypothetical protein n=1 Tax=Candidatus Binatus sp. TaxID=2811406 RepID=UPI00271DCCED|nr:hypothetical protein [Candidatus Binatus sp.]MDO8433106.1 hypothetical protein [Candidatus Binatus sp.]